MIKYRTQQLISLPRTQYLLLFLCGIILLGLSQVSFGQNQTTFRPFATASEEWTETLDAIELEQRTEGLRDSLKEKLDAVSTEAIAVREDAVVKLKYWNALLGSLGEPTEGKAEPEAIAEERARLTTERNDYFTRLKMADLAITRVNLVLTREAKQLRDAELDDYFEQGAVPLLPKYWPDIALDFGKFFQWMQHPDKKENFGGRHQDVFSILSVQMRGVVVMLQITLFLLLLYLMHSLMHKYIRRFGRRYENPSIVVKVAFRFGVAILSALITFLIMFAVLLVTSYIVKYSLGSFTSAPPEQLISLRLLVLDDSIASYRIIADTIEMVLIYIVLNAFLSPRLPRFSLTYITMPKLVNATYHVPLIYFCASLCDELYLALRSVSTHSATITLVTFLTLTLLALYINSLRKRYLSVSSTDESDTQQGFTTEQDDEKSDSAEWLKRFVNKLIYIALYFTIIASAFGYTYMAIKVTSAIGLVILSYIVLKGLRTILYELVGYFSQIIKKEMGPSRAQVRAFASDSAAKPDKPDLLLIIWGITLNMMLIIALVSVTLIILGFPYESILGYGKSISNGISVGDRTISLRNIFDGLVLFTAGILLAKFLNRAIVKSKALSLAASEGVRYSIGTITQYVVMILSFLLAISAMGLDLSSLSLFAGALGVGIGFGLQKVVMNFISGLILLIQRPLQIGDWVEIGPNSGIVKRVNLMNTELETWQRASVIFPNADVMTATFVNRTRGSKQGRIEVKVGVAYGSDLEKVKQLLIDCAMNHPLVMKYQPVNVVFLDFADSSLNFELRCFTHDVFSVMVISSELRFAISEEFKKAGIEIPFPQRVMHQVNNTSKNNQRKSKSTGAFADHDTAAGPDGDGEGDY